MAEKNVEVPNVAESVAEVTLLSWHRKSGDWVEVDDPLCEVETDKANTDLPSPFAGVLKTVAKEGQTVAVGDVIATVDPDAKPSAKGGKSTSGAAARQAERSETTASGAGSPATATAVQPAGARKPASGGNGAVASERLAELSPAVRRLVAEHKLDPSSIPASGPGGRLTKQDVESFLNHRPAGGAAPDKAQMERPQAQPAPPRHPAAPTEGAAPDRPPARPVISLGATQSTRRVAMSKIRKRIAQNLLAAQQNAAILTTFNEVDLTEVMGLRKRYKEPFEKKHGVGLGFMSFFARAAVIALQEFERVNGRIDGDDIIYHDYVNLGIAVSTDRGLTVPVLKNVEQMSFAEMEKEIKRVATAARDGKLGLAEMSGGTFSITNGGVFGSLLSTPIINPPQSAILGMHAIQERPMGIAGEIKLRPMMYLALSYDHRLIDGRESVSFLVRIKQLLEDPARLLLDV